MTTLFQEAKVLFESFHEMMLVHLTEEEEVWPGIYNKYGEAAVDEAMQKILKHELGKKGKPATIAHNLVGSIVTSMDWREGKRFQGPSFPQAVQFSSWVTPEQRQKDFFADVFFPVRTFLMPSWHDAYLKSILPMIECVTGDTDIGYGLPETPATCSCVIA